ncbi:MAG: hypothetical protein P8010_01830 [Desulfosarcinaceae bacterium]|jgi:hypothetical protein
MSFASYNTPITAGGTLPVRLSDRKLNLKHLKEKKIPWLICHGIHDDLVEEDTALVKGMNQKALDYIVGQVPIGRLIEPKEVAASVGDIYRNEAVAGDVFFIHGGLRLGSKG